VFDNYGHVEVTGGSHLGVLFNNYGSVHAQGYLALDRGLNQLPGSSLTADDGSLLVIGAGGNFNSTSSLNAYDVFLDGGTYTFSGGYTSRHSTTTTNTVAAFTGSVGGIGALSQDRSTLAFSTGAGPYHLTSQDLGGPLKNGGTL